MQSRQQIDMREYRSLLARADSLNLVSRIQMDKRENLREALEDYSRSDEELEAASNTFRAAKENQLKKTPLWKVAVVLLAPYFPLIGALFVGLLASGPAVPIVIGALGLAFIGTYLYSTYRIEKIGKKDNALTLATEQCEQVFNKNQAGKEKAGEALVVAASKLKEALDSVEKEAELPKDATPPPPLSPYRPEPAPLKVFTHANGSTLFGSSANDISSPSSQNVKGPSELPTTKKHTGQL